MVKHRSSKYGWHIYNRCFHDECRKQGKFKQLDVVCFSDFIWPFLRPYVGVIPNPKMVFIFPISCILALIFPIVIKYFPKCEGKGSFLKTQIKSLCFDHKSCVLTNKNLNVNYMYFV